MFQLHNWAIGLALWMLILWPAYGQESPTQADRAQAQMQAASNRITAEINSNMVCSTEVVLLQQEIKRLNDKLTEKYEPKADKK